MLKPLLQALRIHQWSKNTFVLAPLVFAGVMLDPASVRKALLAFGVFCCAASAIYLLNDIRDREADRRHPLKRHRPLAAGTLSVAAASFASLFLLALAAAGSLALGWAFSGVVLVYVSLNVLYSLGLKKVVILDILIVSLGFVFRVLAGGAAIGVEISSWLTLCTIFVALLLVLSKRRHEILLLAGEASRQRDVLERYSAPFLDQMINVTTASAVVCYALYAIAPETEQKYNSEYLVYTVPLVLFGIFRYLFLTYQARDARSPTETILSDAPFLINLLLWGLAVVWIVYGT
jgi:4-hydroxybenzoate polyprenyltransferase